MALSSGEWEDSIAQDDSSVFPGSSSQLSRGPKKQTSGIVQNQHHDEAIELSASESDHSLGAAVKQTGGAQGKTDWDNPMKDIDGLSEGDIYDEGSSASPFPDRGASPPMERPQTGRGHRDNDSGFAPGGLNDDSMMSSPDRGGMSNLSESRLSESSDLETSAMEPMPAGAYNPDDYAHLDVSSEVQELFNKITHYQPLDIDIPTKFDPFVPEYLPAAGDIDAFLNLPRPDGRADDTGLRVVREANPKQTDRAVLMLKLRQENKTTTGSLKPVEVKSVSNADGHPNQVSEWIRSISELHASRPLPTVSYTQTMPDIQALMQVWPAEFEELMSSVKLPPADMDVSLQEYCEIVCSLLDIPVGNNIIESVHILVTLFSEFQETQAMIQGGLGATDKMYMPR